MFLFPPILTMMHLCIMHTYTPTFYISPVFLKFTCFLFPLILTMMHLCIMQYTYWIPLSLVKQTRAHTHTQTETDREPVAETEVKQVKR